MGARGLRAGPGEVWGPRGQERGLWLQAYLPGELVATLRALELPDPLMPSDVHAQLLHGCGRGGKGPSVRRGGK